MVHSRVLPIFAVMAAVGAARLSVLTPAAAAQAPPSLVGRWVGTAPDLGFFYDDDTCSQHVELAFQQAGEVVSGQLVSASTASGACQQLLSQEQSTGVLFASRVTGSLSGTALSLSVVTMRTNNDVPNQLTAVIVAGTADSLQLATTGTQIGPRSWNDVSADFIPDCDLSNVAANGECGAAVDAIPVNVSATRLRPSDLWLDFETSASGLDILSGPLSTREGTITASATGGTLFVSGGGWTGSSLALNPVVDTDYAQLAFDFDASTITFGYLGEAGEFSAEVLDSGLSVLDSFFDPDMERERPGGPVTLLGQDVRFFRFCCRVDHVSISATAPTFTDDPLMPGVTPVKAVHFQDLRDRIHAVRADRGLGPFAYTDPLLTPLATEVRAVHLTDLRAALDEVYADDGLPLPAYTNTTVGGGDAIEAIDLSELRAAVEDRE